MLGCILDDCTLFSWFMSFWLNKMFGKYKKDRPLSAAKTLDKSF